MTKEETFTHAVVISDRYYSLMSCSRTGRDSSKKVAALSETVMRLSKTNEQLQLENKGLKADLLRLQEDGVDPAGGRRGKEGRKCFINDALNTLYCTVIWRQPYGKGPLR